ncbi:hypothetical protein [Spirillospora sp. NPDC048824]|uniref:protein kinase domain-containing protein n=1 Tax=Spirillospora sp. NPDC048824 TaxID=3364526 RepID=UPI00371611FE
MRSGLELAGRYRLEEMLGRGGMGEVWRGVDKRLRRPVAVKILPLSGAADGAEVARFRREAEIAATVDHPGVTTVFDIPPSAPLLGRGATRFGEWPVRDPRSRWGRPRRRSGNGRRAGAPWPCHRAC